jgi:hypothetical protein
MRYSFSTTTTDADPSAGNFRYNNATVGSVTQIFMDLVDGDGTTQTTFLDSWDDATGSNKGTLLILSNTNGDATFTAFTVTSVTTAVGYRKIGVTYLSGSVPSNAEVCVMIFSPAGNTGAQGPQGSTLLTTKGDLLSFSTVNARLAVGGTNNHVLTVDSAQATGLKWAAPQCVLG